MIAVSRWWNVVRLGELKEGVKVWKRSGFARL
jgi:hypothetical protein